MQVLRRPSELAALIGQVNFRPELFRDLHQIVGKGVTCLAVPILLLRIRAVAQKQLILGTRPRDFGANGINCLEAVGK